MQLFAPLLFGVSASLDALILGMTYGIRNIRIRLLQNLFISLITLLGTCLFVWFGCYLGPLMPYSLGKWIGSISLILLGLYYLLKCMTAYWKKCRLRCLNTANEETFRPGHDPICAAQYQASAKEITHAFRHELPFGLGDSFFLGIALSVNNIGIGLGASMAGMSFGAAAVTTFLFSAVFLALGNHLGCSRLSGFLGSAAEPFSGLLLLLLGLWELFFAA